MRHLAGLRQRRPCYTAGNVSISVVLQDNGTHEVSGQVVGTRFAQ
jgi:hypothetical protein